MVRIHGSRTPARLRLAAFLVAAPLAVATTGAVAHAAPVPAPAATQTVVSAPSSDTQSVVDRGGRGGRGGHGGDRGGHGRGRDGGGDRGGRGGRGGRCGLLEALLLGCR